MRATAIRVGNDLWRLLEVEAARVGVSVSQYVREAALARASAAAAARGEDPFDLLARAGSEAGGSEEESSKAPERTAFAVEAARDTREDAGALRAQSRQAQRRARELLARRDQDA